MVEEKKIVEKLFQQINSNTGLGSYGLKEVLEMLKNNIADTVIVTDDTELYRLETICKRCNNAVDEIVERIKEYKPDVLAYSVMTGEHIYHIELNQMVKSHYNNAFSVFGGPHPTYCPEMIEKDGIDAICRGEGEIYFPELVEKLEKGQDFYDIKNFWFKKKDGSIVKNKMGKLVPELDANPEPDRKLMYDADKALRVRGTKLFMATRGCPYQCKYCFNNAYNALTKGT